MQNQFSVWKIFYTVTLLSGLAAIVAVVLLYQRTIITAIIPILIIIFIGLTTFIGNKNHYNKVYAKKSFFFPLVQNVFSWGFLTAFGFMAANYYLADRNEITYRFKIGSKASVPGGKGHRHEREPVITFKYFNVQKELVFNYENTLEVERADSVMIKVKKGRLGFDVLSEYRVISK